MDARDMGQDLEKVLFTEEQINDKLVELAAQIDEHYAGRNILVVGVLRGAVMVVADLVRKIHSPVAMDWMAVSSYGSGTKSSGVVRILKDLDTDITDREVLIVEDIIDSGLTLKYLKDYLMARNPKSLKICTLLDKPERRVADVKPDYVGFSIENKFIVGYGLDYNQMYRNLPYISYLEEE